MNAIRKFFEDWTKFEMGLLIIATALMVVLSIIWHDTPIGLLSSVTGVISVVLCAKGRVSNYIFGTVYVAAYAYVAFQNVLYGEVMMNLFYYIPMNVIGFITWTRLAKKRQNEGEQVQDVETRHMSALQRVIMIAIAVAATLGYWRVLTMIGGHLAFIDALSTVAAIIAMYMQVTRYTESWIMWIVTNVISITLWMTAMITEGSTNITMLLMWSAYLINSIYGYINWRKLENNPDADTAGEIATN